MSQKEPNVKVHHKQHGCPIDGRRDEHTHTQGNWRRAVDQAGKTLKGAKKNS